MGSKKRILVLGCNGQLGSEISQMSDQFTEYDFVFSDKEEVDIVDFKKLDIFCTSIRPTYIINCSAYTMVDQAEVDSENCYTINSECVKNIGLIAQKNNISLVHISTDFVFDGHKRVPYNENDETNPISVYGKSKLLGEQELLKIKNLNCAIFRTSWLYSSYGKNFVKTIIKLSAEKDHINVVNDQVGVPTYARDLAHFLLMNIEKVSYDKKMIFHFTNEGSISWYDFANEIIKNKKSNCKVSPIPSTDFKTLAKRPKYSVLSTNKIKKTFNVNIREWDKALAECINLMNGDMK